MSSIASKNLFFLPLKAASWDCPTDNFERSLDGWFFGDQANESLQLFLDLERFEPAFFPLVLYGPSGAGKTSLAISLGERFAKLRSDDAVSGACCHLSSIDFARGLAEAIHTKSVDGFFEKLLSYQAVVIDKLDALAQYPNALIDFCSFLDRLSELRIPCVVTCSAIPEHLPGISDGISSRLAAGLSVPVRLPGFYARCEIVRQLFLKHSLVVKPSEIEALAHSSPLSFSLLQRLVVEFKNTLAASSKLDPAAYSSEKSIACYQDDELSNAEHLDLTVKVVAEHFDILPSMLLSPSRKHTTVLARSIAIYLSRRLFSLNYSLIGQYFGGRDHSTILHSYRKIGDLYRSDSAFQQIVDSLWSKCVLLRSQQSSRREGTLKTC
jgi:chromosomal replication initiator protein